MLALTSGNFFISTLPARHLPTCTCTFTSTMHPQCIYMYMYMCYITDHGYIYAHFPQHALGQVLHNTQRFTNSVGSKPSIGPKRRPMDSAVDLAALQKPRIHTRGEDRVGRGQFHANVTQDRHSSNNLPSMIFPIISLSTFHFHITFSRSLIRA